MMIQRRIVYQILQRMSIIWLLVLTLPIVVSIIVVVVEREKNLNNVQIRVLKKEERFRNESITFLAFRSIG
jgi:heme exporter protein D